jgi:hypothetical protein
VSDVLEPEYGEVDEFVFRLSPKPDGQVWVWREAQWMPFLMTAREVHELTGFALLSRDDVVRRGIPPDLPV